MINYTYPITVQNCSFNSKVFAEFDEFEFSEYFILVKLCIFSRYNFLKTNK